MDCGVIFIAKPYHGALSRSQHNFADLKEYLWYKVKNEIIAFVTIDEVMKQNVPEFGQIKLKIKK